MKPKHIYCLLLLLLPLIQSCRAIIEPNIDNKIVTLEAPGDAYQSSSYAVNFWWDPVDDALSYHLQAVTPSFNNVGALVLDTIVKSNKFTINLSPGTYQWHVMAENGSSKTAYSSPKSFTVLQSSIKQQSVQLNSPASSLLTSQAAVTFSWGALYGATKYQLEIDTNNFTDETRAIYNQLVPGQQVTFTLPKDQVYQWRVRAQNDTAMAQWSAVNTLTLDHTPPAQVTVTAPADNATAPLPVSLQWNAVATATKYKLYAFKNDSTTVYSTSFPVVQSGTSYNFATGNSGDRVYWKITAFDAAGNESKASAFRSFVIQ